MGGCMRVGALCVLLSEQPAASERARSPLALLTCAAYPLLATLYIALLPLFVRS